MSVFGRNQFEFKRGIISSRSITPDSGYQTMSESSRKALLNTPYRSRRVTPKRITYRRSYGSPWPWTGRERRAYSETRKLISNAAETQDSRRNTAERLNQEGKDRSLQWIRRLFRGDSGNEQTSRKLRRRRERQWPASHRNGPKPTSSFTEVIIILVEGMAGRSKLFHIESESTGGMAVRSKLQPLFGLRRVD